MYADIEQSPKKLTRFLQIINRLNNVRYNCNCCALCITSLKVISKIIKITVQKLFTHLFDE